jgi:hypothetical protein
MTWIVNLLHRAGFHGASDELPCLVRLVGDGVQMDLLECPLPCGHTGYRVDLTYYVDELDRWVPVASLRDFNLDGAIALLTRARRCIDNLEERV